MGLFDRFRAGRSDDPLQEEMRRLAPILFPNGHQQIVDAGKSISGMLDNRIPPEAASRIYASTKVLAHTAKDNGKARVVDYIVRQGMGRIAIEEATAIYDRYIAAPAPRGPVHTSPSVELAADLNRVRSQLALVEQQREALVSELAAIRAVVRDYLGGMTTDDEFWEQLQSFVDPTDSGQVQTGAFEQQDAIYIDEALRGKEYLLKNSVRLLKVDAAMLSVFLLGLRSTGWTGAADLFDGPLLKPLAGVYQISERDARYIAERGRVLVSDNQLDAEATTAIMPLLDFASGGAFTLHA